MSSAQPKTKPEAKSTTAVTFASNTSPPKNYPPSKTALEEKLELLEARFTQPHDNANTTPSSEATLGSMSSPALVDSSGRNSSQHSFSFETPSLTVPVENTDKKKDATTTSTTSTKTPTLAAVEQAAAKHMAKVATVTFAEPNQQQQASRPQTRKRVVVRESPPCAPTHTPPATTNTQKANNTKANMPQLKVDKRKSVPRKHELPSVKENFRNNTKRTTEAASQSQADRVITNKRPRSSEPSVSSAPTSLSFGGSSKAPLSPPSSSRDPPGRQTKRHKPPANNALIDDFFKTAVKGTGSSTTTAAAATGTDPPVSSRTVPRSPPSRAKKRTAAAVPTTPTDASKLRHLERRYQDLQRTCQDKDEQLKAVRNNRTILHSALEQALQRREEELSLLQDQQQRDAVQRNQVMEDLVRLEAAQEAKQVREQLAMDGARLGRIVYTRAGLRSVETWEDGFASKQLREKRKDLRQRKEDLEQRYATATEAAEQFHNRNETDPVSTETTELQLKTALEAMEATESVRMHLSKLSADEHELAKEERALNDEKVIHIRALKRVASEDASRFKSRPKLHDRYVLQSLLGKGGFSEVWRAFDLVELQAVAVKIHQLDPRWSDSKKENYTKHVSREYEIHRSVRHPRIVSLFDVFEIDNNSFATVLEICSGSDLDTLLKKKRTLPERQARAILLQILLGMQYLSQPSADGKRPAAIHYDLKPGNILFDGSGDAKITDFGLSKILDTSDPAESMELTSQGAGTYWYLPPECFVMEDTVRISNKVDVWSIGVIYYQMLYGRRPFGDGQSQDKLLSDRTILNAREVSFPEQPSISKEGKEFIRACLAYDQTDRPSIAQLCEHTYILKQF